MGIHVDSNDKDAYVRLIGRRVRARAKEEHAAALAAAARAVRAPPTTTVRVPELAVRPANALALGDATAWDVDAMAWRIAVWLDHLEQSHRRRQTGVFPGEAWRGFFVLMMTGEESAPIELPPTVVRRDRAVVALRDGATKIVLPVGGAARGALMEAAVRSFAQEAHGSLAEQIALMVSHMTRVALRTADMHAHLVALGRGGRETGPDGARRDNASDAAGARGRS